MRFWAGSIKAFASDENNTIAPVIVVGTHTDEVEDPDVSRTSIIFFSNLQMHFVSSAADDL